MKANGLLKLSDVLTFSADGRRQFLLCGTGRGERRQQWDATPRAESR